MGRLRGEPSPPIWPLMVGCVGSASRPLTFGRTCLNTDDALTSPIGTRGNLVILYADCCVILTPDLRVSSNCGNPFPAQRVNFAVPLAVAAVAVLKAPSALPTVVRPPAPATRTISEPIGRAG